MYLSFSKDNKEKQRQNYFTGPREAIRHIVRTKGVFGLYKGFTAMALRDIPSYGIDLVVFEYLDAFMHKHKLTDSQVRKSNF